MGREKNNNEIRIRCISPKLKEELVNISKNTGTSLSSLIKPKLRELVNEFPEQKRQPPLGY